MYFFILSESTQKVNKKVLKTERKPLTFFEIDTNMYLIQNKKIKGEKKMENILKDIVPDSEQKEIKEMITLFMSLPKEDRAVLLSNANAFRVRNDIERVKNN